MRDHSLKYMFDKNKNIKTTHDLYEWAAWYENADRRVKQKRIGDLWISTVFLGLDHQYGDGSPIIFETMIKNKKTDEWLDYQDRYSTWQEAEAGHQKAVKWVKNGCKEGDI